MDEITRRGFIKLLGGGAAAAAGGSPLLKAIGGAVPAVPVAAAAPAMALEEIILGRLIRARGDEVLRERIIVDGLIALAKRDNANFGLGDEQQILLDARVNDPPQAATDLGNKIDAALQEIPGRELDPFIGEAEYELSPETGLLDGEITRGIDIPGKDFGPPMTEEEKRTFDEAFKNIGTPKGSTELLDELGDEAQYNLETGLQYKDDMIGIPEGQQEELRESQEFRTSAEDLARRLDNFFGPDPDEGENPTGQGQSRKELDPEIQREAAPPPGPVSAFDPPLQGELPDAREGNFSELLDFASNFLGLGAAKGAVKLGKKAVDTFSKGTKAASKAPAQKAPLQVEDKRKDRFELAKDLNDETTGLNDDFRAIAESVRRNPEPVVRRLFDAPKQKAKPFDPDDIPF